MKLELTGVQSFSQATLHRTSSPHADFEFLVVEAEAASSLCFCSVQRKIGLLRQLFGRFAVAGKDRDA